MRSHQRGGAIAPKSVSAPLISSGGQLNNGALNMALPMVCGENDRVCDVVAGISSAPRELREESAGPFGRVRGARSARDRSARGSPLAMAAGEAALSEGVRGTSRAPAVSSSNTSVISGPLALARDLDCGSTKASPGSSLTGSSGDARSARDRSVALVGQFVMGTGALEPGWSEKGRLGS